MTALAAIAESHAPTDRERAAAFFDAIRLPPVRRRLATALLDRFDRFVSTEALIAEAWGSRPPSHPMNSLSVELWRMRAKLEPHGLVIKSKRHVGYRLCWSEPA